MPLEENPYIVPHLKALISGQKFWGGQRCGSTLSQEPLALDGAVVRKISKRRFFQDIINSFQGATQLGLKLPQFFSFQKISTNTVARGV